MRLGWPPLHKRLRSPHVTASWGVLLSLPDHNEDLVAFRACCIACYTSSNSSFSAAAGVALAHNPPQGHRCTGGGAGLHRAALSRGHPMALTSASSAHAAAVLRTELASSSVDRLTHLV